MANLQPLRPAGSARAALDQWAEFVQSLVDGKVVPIGQRGAAWFAADVCRQKRTLDLSSDMGEQAKGGDPIEHQLAFCAAEQRQLIVLPAVDPGADRIGAHALCWQGLEQRQ
jgi:hypothetical protein